ncbi:TPA: hypothetical protein N0F65_010287 [Lagenidium giganteum]|uniref:Uncharacterized protein n=1 Tax=Lagenidium giganteum TaxID=4803 RepID=A0AAV2YP88_9STRA|nr:TPA: hypothetical protein N0F65_010287 [Lagenidium giganteum]
MGQQTKLEMSSGNLASPLLHAATGQLAPHHAANPDRELKVWVRDVNGIFPVKEPISSKFADVMQKVMVGVASFKASSFVLKAERVLVVGTNVPQYCKHCHALHPPDFNKEDYLYENPI